MNDAIPGIPATLDYWFGTLTPDGLPSEDRNRFWFGKDAAVDTHIRERFGSQLAAARDGSLDHWRDDPDGLTALIVTLDQFSRNVHRDTPMAFAADAKALALASTALDGGVDRMFPWICRVFVYMPLEHAEDLAAQQRCVACFRRLKENAPAGAESMAETFLHYAELHHDIIARFGRFPHRNSILGRESSEAEKAFLTQPGSSF